MSSFAKWYFNRPQSGNYPAFLPANARGTWNGLIRFISFPTTTNGWLHPYKGNEIIQTQSFGSSSATGTDRIANYRLISIPLDAQTISGTLDVKIGGLEANVAANYYLAFHLYVTEGDTDVVRGTLVSDYADAITEFTTGGVFVSISGIALTSVNALAGDRLVLELGYVNTSVDSVFRSGGVFVGGTINDFDVAPDASTDPNVEAGYIQFSSAIAVQTDPPVNANVDAAIELALDTTTTPTLTLAPDGEVWYKHTTGVAERVFSAAIIQKTSNPVDVSVSWYEKSGGLNVPFLVGTKSFDFGSVVVTIPVQPSTTYYFRTYNSANNPTNTSVNPRNIYLKTFPDLPIPSTALYISDDTPGFGGVLIDSVTGEPLKYLPDFPHGERGIFSPVSLVGTFEGANADDIVIIDTNLDVLVTTPGIFTHDQHNISLYEPACTTDIDGNFYWMQYEDASNFKLTKVSTAGVVLDTWIVPRPGGALGNIISIGISPDKTYLYWVFQGAITTIFRYNIVIDAADTDFAADIANRRVIREALLVNDDGTVYLGLVDNTGVGYGEVRKFADDGTDLGTIYTFTNANYLFNRIKATTNPVGNIIVWIFDDSNGSPNGWNLSQFIIIDGAGTEISSTPGYNFEFGHAVRNNVDNAPATTPTDPPPTFFGTSISCTIIQAPEGSPSGSARLVITKVTNPSPDPTDTDFPFTTTGDLTPDTFELKNGESQIYEDLPAGTYGVTEVVPDGWTVSYDVSNGDPHDVIVLEDGDDVTVIVTNSGGQFPPNPNSGLYRIVPEKRQDTLWDSFDPKRTKDVKIPDPFIKTGLIGK